jgi:hypothetical protein
MRKILRQLPERKQLNLNAHKMTAKNLMMSQSYQLISDDDMEYLSGSKDAEHVFSVGGSSDGCCGEF